MDVGESTAGITENQPPPPRKPRGRPFPKGVSGNPSGRPRDLGDFRAACRSHSAAAVEMLARAMERGDTTAARVLLEYAWGRPSSAPEDLEAARPVSLLDGLAVEQLLELARAATH